MLGVKAPEYEIDDGMTWKNTGSLAARVFARRKTLVMASLHRLHS
jgi:hypothetical protein